MSSAGTVLGNRILSIHGARPDLRLWRNETAGAWVGRVVRRQGSTITLANARMIHAGLAVGSADYIGLRLGGQFLSMELKVGTDRLKANQRLWMEVVQSLGGLAFVAGSVEEVDEYLGKAP